MKIGDSILIYRWRWCDALACVSNCHWSLSGDGVQRYYNLKIIWLIINTSIVIIPFVF